MSIRQGNNIIASTGVNGLSLLDFKWSDHKINDLNWILSSDEWYSGTTYKKIYNHLVNDWETARDSSHQGMSDTIAGITIFYDLADDGHKLVISSYPENVTAAEQIYEATGISWYYILDTTNKRFKLPRTKYAFNSGSLNDVGNYISAGLPNITGEFAAAIPNYHANYAKGAFVGVKCSESDSNCRVATLSEADIFGYDIDASLSSSIYGNSTTVQPPATKMLLYFYADQFTDGGSGKDLTDSTKNIAKWSTNITNCITEIPQNIKVELNSGTLTLKSGSKVYYPDGFEEDGTTKKFDTYTTENDIPLVVPSTEPGNSLSMVVGLSDLGGNLFWSHVSNIYSGDTQPTSFNGCMWYDTTTNRIKRYNSSTSTWETERGGYKFILPICLFTTSDSQTVKSLDQVFNGFGYIGSTVFALPGVKGLVPNGRNADGTLNNSELTINKVITRHDMGVNKALSFSYNPVNFFNYSTYTITEDNYLNSMYGTHINEFVCGTYETDSNGKITKFNPKTVFRAIDYSDKSIITGWSMPSTKYVDLTLPASGGTFTVPANGWVTFRADNVSGGYIEIVGPMNFRMPGTQSGDMAFFMPVNKSFVYKVFYIGFTNAAVFRFIYAEGEI